MNDKTLELIQKLAEKLGTTADHLWSVLIRQAPISATVDLLTIGALLAVGCVLGKKAIKLWDDNFDSEGLAFALTVGAALCLVLGGIGVMVEGSDISAGFLNPEYWALNQLLPKK